MEARRSAWTRLGVWWISVMASATLGACGEPPDQTPPVDVDSFCADAKTDVEAFLGRFRSDPPGGAPRPSTVVVAGVGELASGMNAFSASDYLSVQHQQFVNLMPLIAYDANLEPVPNLAESWAVSDDGTTLTFQLRQDVVWHDGERTDAYDVAFTYERATDSLTAFPNSGYWTHYERGPDGVEVVDDFTVRIRLTPHADFMDPWRSLAIMPEHLLADVPPEELARHPYGSECPVGNGPFVFVEHRPDDRWIFEANPVFPQALGGPPAVERLVYRVIPEETTLLLELLTEAIDVYVAPNPDQAEQILDEPGLELRSYPSRNYSFVAWNSRRPQLSDARVRRALTMAIDREEFLEAFVHGYGRLANSGVPPFHWAYDPEAAATPHDPEKAERVLDDAGWIDRDGDGIRESSDGVPLAFTLKYNAGNRTRQGIAEVMQAQLAAIGVEATPRVVEWGTLLGQVFDDAVRDFDGVVLTWATDFRLDETDLFHSTRADGPTALSGIRSPELDRLLDTLTLVTNRSQARRLWREYQRRVEAEHPYTYLYFPLRLAGVSRRLENVTMDARGELVNVRAWRLR